MFKSNLIKILICLERRANFTETEIGYGPLSFVKHKDLYSLTSDFIKNDNVVYVCCEIKRNVDQLDFKSIELDQLAGKRLFEAHQSEGSGMCEINLGDKKIKVCYFIPRVFKISI